jgi:hypothetical protein
MLRLPQEASMGTVLLVGAIGVAVWWIAKAGYEMGRLSTHERPLTEAERRRRPGTWAD